MPENSMALIVSKASADTASTNLPFHNQANRMIRAASGRDPEILADGGCSATVG